ncbi:uncharacterized protein [Ptychodera flava]|uniref:uncharacterized protein n=1 Tax=Ptychodera flava TaxID=63121 RepID=UPI00396A24C6
MDKSDEPDYCNYDAIPDSGDETSQMLFPSDDSDVLTMPSDEEGDLFSFSLLHDDAMSVASPSNEDLTTEAENQTLKYNCEGFRCFDGQCVELYSDCDTIVHCEDSSDEDDCIPSEASPEDVFSRNWREPFLTITEDMNKYDYFKNSYYKDRGFDRVKGENPPDWNGFLTFSSTPDYSDLEKVLKLQAEDIETLGHQADDLILMCTFNQEKCTPRYFLNAWIASRTLTYTDRVFCPIV